MLVFTRHADNTWCIDHLSFDTHTHTSSCTYHMVRRTIWADLVRLPVLHPTATSFSDVSRTSASQKNAKISENTLGSVAKQSRLHTQAKRRTSFELGPGMYASYVLRDATAEIIVTLVSSVERGSGHPVRRQI